MLRAEHQEILEKRGLDGETLDRYGVISDKGNWIKIPYTLKGKTVNWKSRTISGDKEFRQEKDAVKCFWNADCLDDESLADKPLIITEGELDAMIALQCGFPRTVSVPDGAPMEMVGDKESRKYNYLESAKLDGVKEIILATDSDAPGINLMNDLALRLGKARCKWVKYPKGCKDLNEVFLKYKLKGITETIARAQWCRVDGIYRMSELPPVLEQEKHVIGMMDLSKHYNIRKGDFCVLTGTPSHGKTSFMNEVACRMAMNHNWNIAFASFEQKPQLDHRRNLRSWFNSKRVKDMNTKEIQEADTWIDKHFTFIVPDEDDEINLQWVLEKVATAKIRNNAELIVIDPWNEMDHTRPDNMSLTEYTGYAIKQFKKLAVKYQVHLVVVAHPAKPMRDAKSKKIHVPSLYDISDSAHWYNKADIGIVVHREEKKTIIRIAKSRYHDQIGKPGDLFCTFNIETQTYSVYDENAPV